MHTSAKPQDGGRGVDLLLQHCAALEGSDESRPSPYERLSAALGDEFARMLINALAREPGVRVSRLWAA
jgi:hypothetical protein